MAMPLRLIYNLKVSVKQKVGLVCVFGLGFVMIAFAIIRAKQVLVEQYFVNLTLLMIWSTLVASICELVPFIPVSYSTMKALTVSKAVVVGTLPALKVLVTNRSGTTSRSRPDYTAGSSRRQQTAHTTEFRNRSVPLGSISSTKKSIHARSIDTSDSQEEILHPDDDSKFVHVQHDVVSDIPVLSYPSPQTCAARVAANMLFCLADGVIQRGSTALSNAAEPPFRFRLTRMRCNDSIILVYDL